MRVRHSPPPRAVFASHSSRAPLRLGTATRAALLAAVVLAVLAAAITTDGGRRAVEGPLAALTGRAASPGPQDGYVPVGASVSPWSGRPVVARLAPDVRRAVRAAATDARADGVVLRVNSGWRSARYQRRLFRRAVKTYGDAATARRYVLPPERSEHVRGRAVDVGPTDAALWLEQHGAAYGLCRTYANELWHFERVTAPGGTCPELRTDAAG